MFWPQFGLPAAVATLMIASAPAALAQSLSVTGSVTYPAQPSAAVAQAKTDAMLAALSAQAGIPYLPTARTADTSALSDDSDPAESRLCVRAGLGLSVPFMAGPQMTVEHGLFGCPTDTGGLPIVVSQDPTLQAPPTTRTGDYNLDLTVRYRLVQLRRLQVLAVVSEQGVGYSLDSSVSGNNVMLGMSVLF